MSQDLVSKENQFWDTCAFMATLTTCFRKTAFDQHYRFSGQKSPMINLSIKSKRNNNVNLPSKTTSFRDKDGEKFFRLLPIFGQRWDNRFRCDMPFLWIQSKKFVKRRLRAM